MNSGERPRDFPHRDVFLTETSVDPLRVAEELLGSADHEAYSVVGFAVMKETTARKKALLSEMGDIYRGIDWLDAQEVMTDSGFESVHRHTFYDTDGDVQEFMIYAHTELPVLLVTDSYKGELNSIDFNGAIDSTNLTNEQRRVSHRFGSRNPMSEIPIGKWEAGDPLYHQLSGDLVEGLKIRMDLMEEYNIPLIDWPVCEDTARVSLLDRSESRYLPLDMKLEIQRERLEVLPQRVKDFMQMDKRPEGYTFLMRPI